MSTPRVSIDGLFNILTIIRITVCMYSSRGAFYRRVAGGKIRERDNGSNPPSESTAFLKGACYSPIMNKSLHLFTTVIHGMYGTTDAALDVQLSAQTCNTNVRSAVWPVIHSLVQVEIEKVFLRDS